MPIFRFKAVTESNELIEGEMEASDQAAVIERLRHLGQLPLHAHEVPVITGEVKAERGLFGFGRVSNRTILLITQELATLLKAGVALDRALEILIDLGGNIATKSLLRRILLRLRGGSSLGDAIAEQGMFPPYYASMVRAGEASGSLDIVLTRLAEFLEKSHALRETIKTALYYPIFLLVTAGLSLIILIMFVVPQFKPLFEGAGAALPYSTKMLISTADFVTAYGWLVLLGLVVAFYIARYYLKTKEGRRRWDRFVLRLPLLGALLTKIDIARFSRTTSTLLRNGVGLLPSLAIVQDTLGNSLIASSIDSVAARVKEGRGLADPLMASGLFPGLVVHLVRVGEETGQLDEMLAKLADIYDEEVSRTTTRILSLLVPMLTIGMGILVAVMIASILTAIFSMNSLAF